MDIKILEDMKKDLEIINDTLKEMNDLLESMSKNVSCETSDKLEDEIDNLLKSLDIKFDKITVVRKKD